MEKKRSMQSETRDNLVEHFHEAGRKTLKLSKIEPGNREARATYYIAIKDGQRRCKVRKNVIGAGLVAGAKTSMAI